VGLSRRTNPQTSRDNAQEAIMSKKAEKNLKKKINARKAKIEKHEAKIKSLKKKLKKAS
jgi:Skp family chaperone for outer membrane proteins